MPGLLPYTEAEFDALIARFEAGEQWPESAPVLGTHADTCGWCESEQAMIVAGYLSPDIPCPECKPGAWCGRCDRALQCPACGATSMCARTT